jgi:hypothetical protein
MKNGKQPAFQTSIGMSNSEMEHMGLTKREHFAGLAMQGLLSSRRWNYEPFNEDTPYWTSKFAIEIADELLKQLEK